MSPPPATPVSARFTRTPLVVRKERQQAAVRLVLLAMAVLMVLPLLAIISHLIVQAWPALSWEFLVDVPRRGMTEGGIWPALVGTVYLVVISLAVSAPIGVLAAIYLNEYARDNWFTRAINLAVISLAGVPSIVHALFGLGAFVYAARFGYSILAASLTLAIMTLPVIIASTREALAAVPAAFREACWNVGATRWQTIRSIVLPNSISGILTGVILAVSRALGETAPLVVVGASTFIVIDPEGPFSKFTTLPIQIYQWTSRPQAEFQHLAAAAILVLLVLLIIMNATAVLLRNKYARSY